MASRRGGRGGLGEAARKLGHAVLVLPVRDTGTLRIRGPREWNDLDGQIYNQRPETVKLLHYTDVFTGQPYRPYPNIDYLGEWPYCTPSRTAGNTPARHVLLYGTTWAHGLQDIEAPTGQYDTPERGLYLHVCEECVELPALLLAHRRAEKKTRRPANHNETTREG